MSAEAILSAIALMQSHSSGLVGGLHELLGILNMPDRALVIGINNSLPFDLVHPRYHVVSGKVEAVSLAVGAGFAGAAAASKTAGPVARGAVGVITYDFANEPNPHRLAIMYSVPYDYNLYENWFKLSVIAPDVALDDSLFDDMYNNRGATPGEAAAAAKGTATWEVIKDGRKFLLEGVLGNGGRAVLNMSITMA